MACANLGQLSKFRVNFDRCSTDNFSLTVNDSAGYNHYKKVKLSSIIEVVVEAGGGTIILLYFESDDQKNSDYHQKFFVLFTC